MNKTQFTHRILENLQDEDEIFFMEQHKPFEIRVRFDSGNWFNIKVEAIKPPYIVKDVTKNDNPDIERILSKLGISEKELKVYELNPNEDLFKLYYEAENKKYRVYSAGKLTDDEVFRAIATELDIKGIPW